MSPADAASLRRSALNAAYTLPLHATERTTATAALKHTARFTANGGVATSAPYLKAWHRGGGAAIFCQCRRTRAFTCGGGEVLARAVSEQCHHRSEIWEGWGGGNP